MPAVYDWNSAFVLTTPHGTLPINSLITVGTQTLGYLVLDHEACESGTVVRAVRDDEPQMSGEIVHNHYKTGYSMKLKMELWETIGANAQPACRAVLERLADYLQLHLYSIIGDDPFTTTDGRIQWTPDGGGVDRMLNAIRLLEGPVFTQDQSVTSVEFTVLTPYPYAMDAPETTTTFAVGVGDNTVDIYNRGTAPFWPVVKIYGPYNSFQLSNANYNDLNGDPATLIYDASFPGATSVGSGNYIEFGFFRNTAYLNGNGNNMKAGIDLANSDFFPLVPGSNVITIGGYTGNQVTFLWNTAYA